MATYQFKLPDIGEGIAESEIATWRVELGEVVTEDQPLVDMLTDKAAVEIPSPVAGRVVERLGNAGDKVAVGAPLIVIETDAELAAAPAAVSPAAPAASPAAAVRAATPAATTIAAPARPDGEKPQTSPAVRKRARELGVDIETVPGSGPRGRITREDLEAFVETAATPAPTPVQASAPAPAAAPRAPISG